MSTPLSTATSYLPQTNILVFYDARQWGDLVFDNNTREAQAGLTTDATIAQWLMVGSGEVEAACLVAGKYTPNDLNGLTGASQTLLWKLVADLAFWEGTKRRNPRAKITEVYTSAMEKLERLRLGERIFGLQEVADAGVPNTTSITPQTVNEVKLSTTIARRMFGKRSKNYDRGF